MLRFCLLCGMLGPILLATATTPASGQAEPAPGFRSASWAEHLEREAAAAAVPSPEKARGWLRTLTEEPHVAGTPADYQNAVFVRDRLREWGWKADFAEYECLINYPIPDSIHLAIVRPEAFELPITEDPVLDDKDSASGAVFPAFHGYGASGDVTAQVVYANYGRPDDFDRLAKLGVDVKGKIVLVRYGSLFRGLKVLNAQKRGAVGVLVYSDPADDGYMRGDVYPKGPYRPPSAVQRGSVQFLSLGPGDPSTPGWPSLKNGKRLPFDPLNGFPLDAPAGDELAAGVRRPRVTDTVGQWEKQTNLKRREYFAAIPSLPISYQAARPILDQLAGPEVPDGWQGGLPFAYHVGPGPVEVRLAVAMDYKIRTIWNVLARIDGSVEPERWILLGNHRDAWTYGAVDPGSGTAATLETCRALGEAVKAGWKPRRSLVYASWDGEEYGLLGSTEWAEEMADALGRKAVLMLNVDSAVSGHDLSVSGVPSLRDLFLSAARDVVDPRTGKSLADAWLERQRKSWADGSVALDPAVWDQPTSESAVARVEVPTGFEPKLGTMGSGSDYTAFLDHLGVPALDVDFAGRYGVYHSIYDDFFWMEKFGDPEFLTHATASRLYTRIVMRAAGAEVVPMTFAPYARFLHEQVDDLRTAAVRKARSNGRPFEVPGLAGVMSAVKGFEVQAAAVDSALAALRSQPELAADTGSRLNDALTQVERSFLHAGGLPGRPWFRHTVFAPGLTTGYAAWTLPGLRQALQDDDAAAMTEQARILAERINAAAGALAKIPPLVAPAASSP
jgi:N-acetylated-alpha-linked acidic dipeptidase